MHVLATRVRTIDPTGFVRSVPLVDGGIELQTRISTFPRGGGDLTPQVSGADGLDHTTVGHGDQIPIGVIDNGLHEVVGQTHRVIRILILDAE